MSVGSTLETNRKSMSRWLKASSAMYAMAGPRSEPPMPTFTTAAMRSPVAPRHCPPRTASAKAPIRCQHLVHLGDDVVAVDHQRVAGGPPQRGVQDRAVLGRVDVHASEHLVASGRHSALVRQRQQGRRRRRA